MVLPFHFPFGALKTKISSIFKKVQAVGGLLFKKFVGKTLHCGPARSKSFCVGVFCGNFGLILRSAFVSFWCLSGFWMWNSFSLSLHCFSKWCTCICFQKSHFVQDSGWERFLVIVPLREKQGNDKFGHHVDLRNFSGGPQTQMSLASLESSRSVPLVFWVFGCQQCAAPTRHTHFCCRKFWQNFQQQRWKGVPVCANHVAHTQKAREHKVQT